MNPQRLLVLGAHGMLGAALSCVLRAQDFAVIVASRRELDANRLDTQAIAQLIERAGADAVVNAIGMINRRLDHPEAEFLRVNSLFPRLLADTCVRQQRPLIHISTDCVFKGDAGPYDETRPADADDLYGRSKAWGEPGNAMVLRTSIIGPETHHHYALLSWFLAQHGPVRGFQNHQWNGLTTLELARVIGVILRQKLWQPGLFHLHGEDLSKCTLLEMLQETFGGPRQVVPVDDECARDTRLRSRHTALLAQLQIAPMHQQLAEMRAHCTVTGGFSPSATVPPAPTFCYADQPDMVTHGQDA